MGCVADGLSLTIRPQSPRLVSPQDAAVRSAGATAMCSIFKRCQRAWLLKSATSFHFRPILEQVQEPSRGSPGEAVLRSQGTAAELPYLSAEPWHTAQACYPAPFVCLSCEVKLGVGIAMFDQMPLPVPLHLQHLARSCSHGSTR